MRIALLLIAFVVFLGATPTVEAQFSGDSFGAPATGIVLQPASPAPGESVTATVNDFRSSSFGTAIYWYIDGEELEDSANFNEITFNAGPAGVRQTVQAVLVKPDGSQETLSTVIVPLYLDIIIEPQTRVPDFYQGRALPSVGSIINATAILSDGNTVYGTDLIYNWRVNRTSPTSGVVRGRNQVSFPMPQGRDTILSLDITTLGGEQLASRSLYLPSVQPSLEFYEVSSLFGQSHQAISGTLPIIGNTAILRAEPYNLDSRVYNNPDVTEWEIDNIAVANTSRNPYEITLQRLTGGGRSSVNFHVRDTTQFLQGAEDAVEVSF